MWFIPVLFILIAIFIYTDTKKPPRYPPGPRWLPVVGNYPLLREELARLHYHHLVWSHLSRRYGPVVGLRLGRDRIVIVSGHQAIRAALARQEFEGRPDGFFFKLRTFNKRLGVVFTDGAFWQEQRRFCLKHLRDLGLGKSVMESRVREEAAGLVTSLRRKSAGGNVPVAMHDAFDICVLNSLWAMLAGKRFSLDDTRLSQLLDIVHASFRMLDMSGGVLNQMPFLRFLTPEKCGYTSLVRVLKRMRNFLKETVAEHRTSMNSDCPRDLIDSFLQEMARAESQPNCTFSEEQLLSLCLDLFMAGSETTSNTLGFASLYMMLHPEVQLKVQQELDAVIGRDRQPALQDRPRLCYVEAVLMEVQRHSNVVPVAVAHRAMDNTRFMGYTIPKDAILLISLYSLHMDHDHWGDPETFRPERFLNSDNTLVQDDWFMPFGYGKRRCLGEALARSSLFLFFTTLLQNFTLSQPEGQLQPSLHGYDGITISPRPFMTCLKPRK